MSKKCFGKCRTRNPASLKGTAWKKKNHTHAGETIIATLIRYAENLKSVNLLHDRRAPLPGPRARDDIIKKRGRRSNDKKKIFTGVQPDRGGRSSVINSHKSTAHLIDRYNGTLLL